MEQQFTTKTSVTFLQNAWNSPNDFFDLKDSYECMIPHVEYLYDVFESNRVNDISLIKKKLPNMANYFETWEYPNKYHKYIPYHESVVCKVFWELYH